LILSVPPVASGIPPKYETGKNGLILEGVSSDNPVIYDNDWWTDVPDAAYLWAKASLGKCNLRGNIITRCTFGWEKGYAHKLDEQTKDCDKLLKAAKASGLMNIPDPVLGAEAALRKPASGVIADTKFVESAGSKLIVAEARKASAKKPLLIFCGGSCTTIATAYLADPTIADKVIVFQIDGGGYNGSDQWAWQITMKRFRFANWARGYFWKEVSTWDPTPFKELPDNPLGRLLKEYARSNLGKANQWGDGAWVYHLFDSRCLTKAEDYDKNAITVPKSGTNAGRMRDEFVATMTNPAVYHKK
jgi:hypothetical protein